MTTATASTNAQPKKAPLPFYKQIIAGGSAGVIEILVMYPTDVLKTRAQLSLKSRSMFQTASQIVKNEGFANFYRGIGSPILAEAPKRATKFACNEQYREFFRRPSGEMPVWAPSLAGAMAGSTEVLVNCPFEVVKVRMQSKDGLQLYKSTFDCFQRLLRQEGARALYRGAESHVWRNASWNGTYFGMIGHLRETYSAPPNASKSEVMLTNLMTGSIGGFFGALMNTPFDVAKSRMQNQVTAPGAQPKYAWTLQSLSVIAKEEGAGALYKGLGPRLLRLGPGGGIMLVAFDKCSEWLRDE